MQAIYIKILAYKIALITKISSFSTSEKAYGLLVNKRHMASIVNKNFLNSCGTI